MPNTKRAPAHAPCSLFSHPSLRSNSTQTNAHEPTNPRMVRSGTHTVAGQWSAAPAVITRSRFRSAVLQTAMLAPSTRTLHAHVCMHMRAHVCMRVQISAAQYGMPRCCGVGLESSVCTAAPRARSPAHQGHCARACERRPAPCPRHAHRTSQT